MSADKNVQIIRNSLNKYGITNPYLQAGILATIKKESEFIPRSENLNYSYKNIKRVWPKTSDADAKRLANNPEALGNFKYGGRYGNAANEGFKYRGRGFNQITFKDNYRWVGSEIGRDLVKFPDLLNDVQVAADAAAVFFRKELKAGERAGDFKKFGVTDTTKISTLDTATKVAIQINGGRKTDFNNNILQEGYKKALNSVSGLYAAVSTKAAEEAKKKPVLTGLIITAMIVSLVLIIKNIKQNGR